MKSDKHTNASNRNADPEAVKAAVAHLRESVANVLKAKADEAHYRVMFCEAHAVESFLRECIPADVKEEKRTEIQAFALEKLKKQSAETLREWFAAFYDTCHGLVTQKNGRGKTDASAWRDVKEVTAKAIRSAAKTVATEIRQKSSGSHEDAFLEELRASVCALFCCCLEGDLKATVDQISGRPVRDIRTYVNAMQPKSLGEATHKFLMHNTDAVAGDRNVFYMRKFFAPYKVRDAKARDTKACDAKTRRDQLLCRVADPINGNDMTLLWPSRGTIGITDGWLIARVTGLYNSLTGRSGAPQFERLTCESVNLLAAIYFLSYVWRQSAGRNGGYVPIAVGLDERTLKHISTALWLESPFFMDALSESQPGELLAEVRDRLNDPNNKMGACDPYCKVMREVARVGERLMAAVLPETGDVGWEDVLAAEILLARFYTDSADSLLQRKAPLEKLLNDGELNHLTMRTTDSLMETMTKLQTSRKWRKPLSCLAYKDDETQAEIPLDDRQFGLWFDLPHVKDAPALLERAASFRERKTVVQAEPKASDKKVSTFSTERQKEAAEKRNARTEELRRMAIRDDLRMLRAFLGSAFATDVDRKRDYVIPGLGLKVSPSKCLKRKSRGAPLRTRSYKEGWGPQGSSVAASDGNGPTWEDWAGDKVNATLSALHILSEDFWNCLTEVIRKNESWWKLEPVVRGAANELYGKLPYWMVDFGLFLPEPEEKRETAPVRGHTMALMAKRRVPAGKREEFDRQMKSIFESLTEYCVTLGKERAAASTPSGEGQTSSVPAEETASDATPVALNVELDKFSERWAVMLTCFKSEEFLPALEAAAKKGLFDDNIPLNWLYAARKRAKEWFDACLQCTDNTVSGGGGDSLEVAIRAGADNWLKEYEAERQGMSQDGSKEV